MKKILSSILQKVIDNKEIVIRVGTTAVMAGVGVLLAKTISDAQDEISLVEEIIMSVEEETDLA